MVTTSSVSGDRGVASLDLEAISGLLEVKISPRKDALLCDERVAEHLSELYTEAGPQLFGFVETPAALYSGIAVFKVSEEELGWIPGLALGHVMVGPREAIERILGWVQGLRGLSEFERGRIVAREKEAYYMRIVGRLVQSAGVIR